MPAAIKDVLTDLHQTAKAHSEAIKTLSTHPTFDNIPVNEPLWFSQFKAKQDTQHLTLMNTIRRNDFNAMVDRNQLGAKLANSRATAADHNLTPIPRAPAYVELSSATVENPPEHGPMLPPPDNFPSTVGELHHLKARDVNALLTSYGMQPVNGAHANKRALCHFIGCAPPYYNPNAPNAQD